MSDSFEENLGKFPFITLPQVKDYLLMTSNSADARLSNIIFYATGVIEHYIGQEILANNYLETFDGGRTSIFVNRLPLSNVYQVTEYDGNDFSILADPSTIGAPNKASDSSLQVSFYGNAKINDKIKHFGQSSLYLDSSSYLLSSSVPDNLQLDESDFTIEAFIRVDNTSLASASIISFNTNANTYLNFNTEASYGLKFEANINGVSNTVVGANTLIESQNFVKRRWAHVAVCRNLEEENMKLFYNGKLVANSNYSIVSHNFTSNVRIGNNFTGYLDELRVSKTARYDSNFTVPTHRFRPDNETVALLHFDGKNNDTSTLDSHALSHEYSYSKDTGEISKSVHRFPNFGSIYSTFQPFQSGITVEYRAGYEINNIPYDLQLATLDFIKLLYKQDQDKKGISFEGERGDKFSLSSNSFPPHITRVLDLYRIIK